MATRSLLRQRYLARQPEVTQQLIAFLLRQEWFALPIETVLKVVPMTKVYGDPQKAGIGLTIYQGSELLVVDVGERIFGEAPSLSQNGAIASQPRVATVEPQRYLLIVQNSADVFGLPIDSPPVMRRVSESSFTPLPDSYIAQGNIQCVTSLMIPATDQPPLFLLDSERLI